MNSYEYVVKWLIKSTIMISALTMAEKFHPEEWHGLENLIIIMTIHLSVWLWDSQGVKLWNPWP